MHTRRVGFSGTFMGTVTSTFALVITACGSHGSTTAQPAIGQPETAARANASLAATAPSTPIVPIATTSTTPRPPVASDEPSRVVPVDIARRCGGVAHGHLFSDSSNARRRLPAIIAQRRFFTRAVAGDPRFGGRADGGCAPFEHVFYPARKRPGDQDGRGDTKPLPIPRTLPVE